MHFAAASFYFDFFFTPRLPRPFYASRGVSGHNTDIESVFQCFLDSSHLMFHPDLEFPLAHLVIIFFIHQWLLIITIPYFDLFVVPRGDSFPPFFKFSGFFIACFRTSPISLLFVERFANINTLTFELSSPILYMHKLPIRFQKFPKISIVVVFI